MSESKVTAWRQTIPGARHNGEKLVFVLKQFDYLIKQTEEMSVTQQIVTESES